MQEEGHRSSKEEEHKKEEMIRVLDRNLENSEKKFLKLQSESDVNRNEVKQLRSKL